MLFSSEVPKLDRSKSLDLERCPAKKKIGGIITSPNLIGAFTHYTGGRTMPCEGTACPICAKKTGKRWHGWVGVYQFNARRHFLFEFTALAAEEFQKYVEIAGTLRGCAFTAERKGWRNNAPVGITCQPANLNGISLPPAPNIPEILSIIWGIGEAGLVRDGAYAYSPLMTVDEDLLDDINGPAKDRKARLKESA